MSTATQLRFLNPFIRAAADVLEKEVGAQTERGPVGVERTAHTTQDVTALIGVTGRVRGVVAYGMSDETARTIVGVMLGEPCPVFDELAQSGIAELANVITGRASIELANNGFPAEISTPTIIVGKALLSTLDTPRLMVPLRTGYGEIIVHLALREATGGNGRH